MCVYVYIYIYIYIYVYIYIYIYIYRERERETYIRMHPFARQSSTLGSAAGYVVIVIVK